MTEETGVTGQIRNNTIVMHDYVITMLYDDVMRRKVTQRSTHERKLSRIG